MARPTTIRREQILDAARALFLEQGLSVSTATIAKAAGVSEGTIFKRFSNKDTLFFEAMCPAPLDLELEGAIDGPDVQATLVSTGVRLIAFFRELIPRMMRLWAHSSTGETPIELMRRHHGAPPPVRLVQSVRGFVQGAMDRGRLAPGDAEIVARTLVASMHNWVFLELIGEEEAPEGAAEAYAQAVVQMLWQGIAPAAAKEEQA